LHDDFLKIGLSLVGLGWGELEHPSARLHLQGEIKLRVLLGQGLKAAETQLQLFVLVQLQEVPFDLLAPLDDAPLGLLLPVSEIFQHIEELFDT
jgi:hypothetical protein